MKAVNNTTIDSTLHDIRKKLWARHTLEESQMIVSPLAWYINTGRAPTPFLRLLVNMTERQKTTVAKRLEMVGTDNDAINSICKYLKFEREYI